MGTDVADGPDPFADPVTRRAILAVRPARAARLPRTTDVAPADARR
jgi:hypothetical protein